MEDAPVLIILTESDGARSRGSAEPECSKYHQLRHENRCALVLLLSAYGDFSQDQDLLWSVPQRFLSHSSTFCFSEGIMYIFPFSFCLKKKKKRKKEATAWGSGPALPGAAVPIDSNLTQRAWCWEEQLSITCCTPTCQWDVVKGPFSGKLLS